MKILMCTNAFAHVTNGPAKFAQLLLQLNTLYPQHEVRVLTEDTPGQIPDKVYQVKLWIPRMFKPLGMFLRMFQYHNSAMRIRKEYPFDILIYNNAIVSLWSALNFKKVVGFINDDNHLQVKWLSDIARFRLHRAHIFWITERLACRWCKTIVVNSNYLYEEIQRMHHPRDGKLQLMYKAIEIIPESHTRNNAIPVVLFAKNDYHRGGLFILLEALKILDQPVVLQVVGPPEEAKALIENALTTSKIQLEFYGMVPQQKLYDLMRKADIFCVPALREALGVANMEALALGCTIVSTRTGGIPEVLEDGAGGWLAKPGDTESLASCIREALDNPALRAQKNAQGILSLQRFTVDAVFNRLMAILNG